MPGLLNELNVEKIINVWKFYASTLKYMIFIGGECQHETLSKKIKVDPMSMWVIGLFKNIIFN